MKCFFEKFLCFTEWFFRLLMLVGILGMLILFGRFFLDLFGVISYAPPIDLEGSTIIRVDLVNAEYQSDTEIIAEITQPELDQFLDDFMQISFKRYANDPPEPYGDWLVIVHYSDGHADWIGNEMNQRFDASGNAISTGGWYYCPGNEMEVLFSKYTR